ncbi:MAG: hypothetical protein ACI97A_003210 [Planctomycetota bacterium]|jgi:hypothetical protein
MRNFHSTNGPRVMTRRHMLGYLANGFGAVAAAALLPENGLGSSILQDPNGAKFGPHFPPRAKNVIFLYMDGGPSQVDTFDPKPRLAKEHGQPIKMKIPATQFDNVGTVLKSPWDFHRYGESGIPVSDLFPHVAKHVDKLCIVRSMVSKFSEHPGANYFLHTGHGLAGRPTMGAWATYGLGSTAKNLPGFTVLNGGLVPPGGLETLGNGFLPATYQASVFKAGPLPLANITRREKSASHQRSKLDLIKDLDGGLLDSIGSDDQIESAIRNAELAHRMQTAVPELMNIKGETEETRKLYGLKSKYNHTRSFGQQCLIARRLVERGVRFVELTCPNVGVDRWDQHNNLKDGHAKNALAVDEPIAGLLADLAGRGLLDSTLVVWAGEFGRTPMAQGSNGRDHNPFGFTIWLAGGGVKGGHIHGATDDYGYYAVDKKMEIYDLHATMLHLLGLDHKKLTYPFSGRDMRLTDVHGHVVHDLIS